VFIRWSDYIGRKRVLLGIMIVLCVGTVLCLVSTSLPVLLVGRSCRVAATSRSIWRSGPIVG
jgi:predicted MFS family arabinose efflux permease